MKKFFTTVLVMAAVVALAASPALAQSGSKATDDQQAEKLREFIFGKGAKPAPTKPAVLTPGKSSVKTPPAPDKSKATFVGKVGEEKMSPARKACVDKCESGRARCNNICEQAQKTNDAMMKIDCQNCLQAIITCVNRCPAK